MANEVKLPRLGQGMESGTIVKWLKAEGDRVEKGEPLYELDTDKATQEVEAEASGVLIKIAIASGEVPVGETIAMIGEPGEAAPEQSAVTAEAAGGNGAVAAAPRPAAPAPVEDFRAAISGALGAAGGRAKASPLARRMARERGIDLGRLTGTGPDGRIVADDIERAEATAAAPQPPAPSVEAVPVAAPTEQAAPEPASVSVSVPEPVAAELGDVESLPLSNVRKTIARRLTAAWQVPVFQLTISVDMTHANALVERSRELNPAVRVTVTDLLAKVCARSLMRHREVNSQFTESAILRLPSANIGLAVAAPQGLVVPVIPSAERLSLVEVAQARSELVAKARDGKLQLSDLEGGTFTISNLGMYGVEQFVAVLNPPQAAILAVGATVDQPVVREGEIVVRPMMAVTLTVDHRAVDGGPAAEFLQTVKTFLEDPALAL